MANPTLTVHIEVIFQANNRAQIIGIVRNGGTEMAEPGIFSSELLVDGVPWSAWTLATGNGTIDARLVQLPPGDEVAFHREVSLPGRPGSGHQLVLRLPNATSPTVTL